MLLHSIPVLQTMENEKVKDELKFAYEGRLSLIFDGTTEVAESFAMIVRFLCSETITINVFFH